MSTSFRELEVWRKAMDLASEVYRFVRVMPKQEEYRPTAQLVRAAISIPANIAEGHARATRKEYAQFISIARGSAAELDTLIELAMRAEFANPEVLRPLAERIEHISRMLNRLHARLRDPPSNPQSPVPNPHGAP
ncbi:MAG: four helix bundle protein [Hyphomonadaceae bacterium]|nr:four helix bundle protein [Hyphomonadaceae bacterium]